MSDIAIRAEGLSKLYRIGERESYFALRDVLTRWISAPFRALRPREAKAHQHSDQLWALNDLSFTIRKGEVVGIIGRNGAGKSTLLKVLARVTKPTRGMAEVRGRMGTLLEVGTGFHPELTGRENISLSGAILGMKKTEILRNFDQIVAFAEVEQFIDTPVKHYSSGMYTRLAFAVAAHLEPEILIVDEVLAVGDLEFQRKCLAKMKDVSRGGRTVLFVSHNMAAVQSLCTRAIVLKNGSLLRDCEDPTEAIAIYSSTTAGSGEIWERPLELRTDGPMAFRSMAVQLKKGGGQDQIQIDAEVESLSPHAPAYVAFDILDGSSVPVMQAIPTLTPFLPYEPGVRNMQVTIDLPLLIPDKYQITAWVGQHNTVTYDYVHSVVSFEILTSPTPGRSFPHTRDHGHIVPPSRITSLPHSKQSLLVQSLT